MNENDVGALSGEFVVELAAIRQDRGHVRPTGEMMRGTMRMGLQCVKSMHRGVLRSSLRAIWRLDRENLDYRRR
jgi:hypothetical protein